VHTRCAKACLVRSRSGDAHTTTSVCATRTHSLTLPGCRYSSPSTNPTITGKVSSRAPSPSHDKKNGLGPTSPAGRSRSTAPPPRLCRRRAGQPFLFVTDSVDELEVG
jgi:hypothetical protein